MIRKSILFHTMPTDEHSFAFLISYLLSAKIQLSSLPRHYQQELALLTIPSNEKVIPKKHILYSDELVDPIIRYLEEHLSENFCLNN